MSQQQAVLPFNQLVDQSFAQYKGNDAVLVALQKPEKLPQFCYIWGGALTGKTHLLGALGIHLGHRSFVCFAVDASQLMAIDWVEVLPTNIQFLLIDDVDKLASSDAGELALFNLFNHCKSHAIKLVVTSSIHAKNSLWQLPDLVSRLNSGLTLGLEPLRGPQALLCIEQKFKLHGIRVDDAVMQYLQTHQSSSFPELFQLFTQVATESLKLKRKVTVPLVKQALKNVDYKDSQV